MVTLHQDDKRPEYLHYDLGHDMHFGKHRQFGTHIAIGKGPNMLHIFPDKILIGANESQAVPLNPAQRRAIVNIMDTLERGLQNTCRNPSAVQYADGTSVFDKPEGTP